MKEIFCALEECENLKKTSLVRSGRKRIFADYGKRVMYTCAGVQVSRNAQGVLNYIAYMELSEQHLRVLMKLMRHAEYSSSFLLSMSPFGFMKSICFVLALDMRHSLAT